MSDVIEFPAFPGVPTRNMREGPSPTLMHAIRLAEAGFPCGAINQSGMDRFVPVHVSGRWLKAANEGSA